MKNRGKVLENLEQFKNLTSYQKFILFLLQNEDLKNLSKLAKILSMTHAHLSIQFGKLREEKLVERKKKGRESEYVISKKGIEVLDDFLDEVKG